jgi:hypothetical protein
LDVVVISDVPFEFANKRLGGSGRDGPFASFGAVGETGGALVGKKRGRELYKCGKATLYSVRIC